MALRQQFARHDSMLSCERYLALLRASDRAFSGFCICVGHDGSVYFFGQARVERGKLAWQLLPEQSMCQFLAFNWTWCRAWTTASPKPLLGLAQPCCYWQAAVTARLHVTLRPFGSDFSFARPRVVGLPRALGFGAAAAGCVAHGAPLGTHAAGRPCAAARGNPAAAP